MPSEVDDFSLADILGEHRDLPGDDEAMFTVEELATTNTVLRGVRMLLNDRIGEAEARPLAAILTWAQSIILTMVLEDAADDHSQLECMAEMFAAALGDDAREDIEGQLPYGKTIDA